MRNGVDCFGNEWQERTLSRQMKDLTGQTFHRLTALFPVKSKNSNHTCWLCSCECGNILVCRTDGLLNGHTKSCGCWKIDLKQIQKNTTRINMIGKTFGKLTVIALDYTITYPSGSIRDYYKCMCSCGSECSVMETSLVQGATQSCGCIKSHGETNVKKILDEFNISYLHDKGYFKDLRGENGWLLRYDFILFTTDNSPFRLIEFDGPQHNVPIDSFGGNEKLLKQQQNDTLKNQYALSHNIPLVRIPYSKRDTMSIDDLLGDKYLIKGDV